MIKTFEENGQTMVAVVLGDAWSNDPERYRNSLLNVLNASIVNEQALENGFPSGSELSDCIRLARALEQKPVVQKGGNV